MNILIVGSGAREHCLAWKISQSSLTDKIYCAPGNGGTADVADNISIEAEDIDRLLKFALNNNIGLTIVGPEVTLVEGIVDVFSKQGLRVFGPCRELARLEGSKIYAKEIMRRYSVPTADYEIFDDPVKANAYIDKKGMPLVVKADGLAAGKGVVVCAGAEQAKEAVKRILVDNEFGPAGRRIIIEECLKGQEASVLVLTDGETIVPLVCAQDHKPIYDNDQGPNTGGMGAYAPAPIIDDRRLDKIIDIVFKPVIQGLKKEGKTYKGVLYGGLMIDGENINVLEFNVRFGDPETQVILPKLNGDLVDIMCKVTEGRLHQAAVSWDQGWCVCVVIAAGGYPGKYDKGKNITGLDHFAGKKDLFIFHAGTKLAPNQEKGAEAIVTNGGRVLSAVALGDSLKSAQEKVYSAVKYIHFENMFYRKDIANKAL